MFKSILVFFGLTEDKIEVVEGRKYALNDGKLVEVKK